MYDSQNGIGSFQEKGTYWILMTTNNIEVLVICILKSLEEFQMNLDNQTCYSDIILSKFPCTVVSQTKSIGWN